MRQWVHHIWLVLLTGMLVLGIGLRGLPAPCQNGLCGTGGCATGGCATSATPCPPSCTCHWSQGPDGDVCCHPARHGQHAHDDPAMPAALAHHGHDHGMPDPAVTGHHGHDHGSSAMATHPGDGTSATAPPHCAPSGPAADDPWPNLSLPHVQPPALLAAGLALDFFALPPTATAALPAVIAWAQPPPTRPPAA